MNGLKFSIASENILIIQGNIFNNNADTQRIHTKKKTVDKYSLPNFSKV